MQIVQILLAIILIPVLLHLLRILVMSSPGHSRALTPLTTGTSGVAMVGLLIILVGTLAKGEFDPLDLPKRADIQHDIEALEHSDFLKN